MTAWLKVLESVRMASHSFSQPGKFQVLGKPLHWTGLTLFILQMLGSSRNRQDLSSFEIIVKPLLSGVTSVSSSRNVLTGIFRKLAIISTS